jgi:hypothetical protein
MVIIFETRELMVNSLISSNSIIGEIGVFKGDFSKFLCNLHPQKLILIDTFQGVQPSGDQDGNNIQWVNLNDEYIKIKQWAINQNNITVEKGDSSSILSIYPNEFFAMIYLDGDHSYEGVKKDLEQAIRKVKKSGWIMGHDYEMNMKKAQTIWNFGVRQAVDEFCQKYNQTIFAKGNDGCVSFAIKINIS